jgi:two-component system chemotaxis response regulator CheB
VRKIRILIVDDSVVIRRLLSNVLSTDPAIEVAGTAPSGALALAKIPQVNPDLITMDVEMPDMNGLEALASIRKSYPDLPVIMFTSANEKSASIALDALALGAKEFVVKPANLGTLDASLHYIQEHLIDKIKSLCARLKEANTISLPSASAENKSPILLSVSSVHSERLDVVAIGISTGGPNALAELIPQIPGDIPIPIVIVQHMPPLFTKLLADRLAAKAAIRVSEAVMGEILQPGHAYIAPGDFHMAFLKNGEAVRISLHQGPPENSCRPAVDVLFRSVAEIYGAAALALVMTGMGKDGLRGCERIKEAGGQIVVQDEATSVVWAMPGAVANAGLAEKILPLNDLSGEIVRRVRKGRVWTGSKIAMPVMNAKGI